MSLQIYNTLTRKKEIFEPLVDGRVSLYVCGPTVYGHSHLGHAKSYVSFDVVARWLRQLGYKVKYVQNITDVGHLTDDADEGDDKIIAQAKREHIDPMEVAQFYARSFFADMDALGNQRPNISPTATGHIPEQIALIEQLIEKNHAYEVNGNVYFDVASFEGYGKLSGRINQEELEAGARVEVRSEKRHPADFALWKKAEPNHLMKWASPWGVGYPGWHIECSAMSMKYLGETFDIHGGGLENQFPHHDCEIAQSECATGKPFVRYWMHNNMVTVNGQKMGKSLGNSISLKDIFKKFPPVVIRFFILQSHYRSTLDFSDAAIEAAQTGLKKLQESAARLNEAQAGKTDLDLAPYEQRFTDAMNDDFNAPMAIAVLFDLAREINSALAADGLSATSLENAKAFFETYANGVLGILSTAGESDAAGSDKDKERLEGVMALVLELRQAARKNKDFATADKIRDGLTGIGIEVKDTKDGAIWKTV
ncbi:cysteine--tRNA ligase [Chloroherpeton thalassium]|nr:cysteine--tRNA ligase [Chloroherpeton thalassium]